MSHINDTYLSTVSCAFAILDTEYRRQKKKRELKEKVNEQG